MKLLARTPPRKKSRTRIRIPWKLTLLGLPVVLVFAVLLFYAVWAQTYDLKKVGDMPERNTVFDVDGKIYSRLAGANRVKVALNEVSPYFIDALVAREDTRFFEHGGVDWWWVARGPVPDIKSGLAEENESSMIHKLAPE